MFKLGSFEIEGFSFNRRTTNSEDTPLGWAFLPLNAGLTVLYGLNGAGKSLLLEGVEAAMTGIQGARPQASSPEVLLRVADDAFTADTIDNEATIAVDAGMLYRNFGTHRLMSHGASDWADCAFAEAYENYVDEINFNAPHYFSLMPVECDPHDFGREVAGQRRFSLSPTGSVGSEEWDAVAVVSPDGISGALHSLLRPSEGEPHAGGMDHLLDFYWGWYEGEDPEPKLPKLFDRQYLWWAVRPDEFVPGYRGLAPVYGRQAFSPDEGTRAVLNRWMRLLPSVDRSPATDGEHSIEITIASLVQADLALSSGVNEERLNGALGLNQGNWLVLTDDGRISGECGLAISARIISRRANVFYARLLMDAPVLEFDCGRPSGWISGTAAGWGARRTAGGRLIALDFLSEAERRWAGLAIELALSKEPSGVLVIDEPERALHRSAEAFMARGLNELTREFNIAIVVATHSPELLNIIDAHVHIVRRKDQGAIDGTQVVPMTSITREELTGFGLLPSDLLRRQRAFLLVEGQHDLIVLSTIFEAELQRLRVELLPMRGASRLRATLDSRVLYDFTDAHMFVLLDALDATIVSSAWREAVRLVKTVGVSAAVGHVQQALGALTGDEAGSLAAFMTRALERGLDARHTPLALSAADILEYLPVDSFVPGATSWKELREELTRSTGSVASGSQFKRWLVSAKRADLSDDAVERATRALSAVPQEMTDLMNQVRAVLDQPATE